MINWEEATVEILNRRAILDVLAIQMSDFAAIYSSRPDIVFLPNAIRGSFTREVIRVAKMPAEAVVADPVWLDGIPVLFNTAICGDDFMVLRNSAKREELRL